MGGTVTVWALHLPEGMARDAQGFAGTGGPCTSQKATMPEFPVTSEDQHEIGSHSIALQPISRRVIAGILTPTKCA
jgi:hypothetical protein